MRLIGATRDVGCSTGPNGVTGYLYVADTQADIASFTTFSDKLSRAVLLPPGLLTAANIATLSSVPYLAGLLVTPGPFNPSEGFSPASAVLPDGRPSARAWNPAGRNLTQARYPFPIVSLAADEAADLRAKGLVNQGRASYTSFPQHAVRLFFYMGPDGLTSGGCLDAQQCLPLGGQSVWGSLGPLHAAPQEGRGRGSGAGPQRPVVMAVASLDAGGLFHDSSFGADATVSGLVALLAAAHALGALPASRALPLQILVGAFQGEAYGRIGSRRWLREVGAFNCSALVPGASSATGVPFCAAPLRTSLAFTGLAPGDFATVIAADQVGARGLSSLWLRGWATASRGAAPSPLGSGDSSTETVAAVFAAAAGAGLLGPITALPAAAPQAAPPPSPVETFLESAGSASGSGSGVTALMLSGYDSAYASRVYHSQYDNATTVDAGVVTAAATLLARSLFALATNASTPAAAAAAVPASLVANATVVASLLSCLTVSAQCPLFSSLLGIPADQLPAYLPAGPLPLYTSVYTRPYMAGSNGYVVAPSPVEGLARNFLAVALAGGDPFGSPVPQCNATAGCAGAASECIAGTCVNATSFYHDALSPAVTPSDVNYGQYAVDASQVTPSDPAWAEPYWSGKIGVTLLLADSPATEGGVLAAGLVTAIACVGITWLLTRYLDTHYKTP